VEGGGDPELNRPEPEPAAQTEAEAPTAASAETEPEAPTGATAEEAPTASPRHRWGVRVLLLIATLLTIFAILAIYVNRQVLDANNWSKTSTAMLANPAIRTALSEYLITQVYANVNVAGTLQSALPPALKPLAGEAAGALQQAAQKVAFEVLGRPRVQAVWKAANKTAAQQFVNIVESKSKAVKLQGNQVILNLQPILVSVANTLGLPGTLVQKIPPDAAQLKVLKSDQVKTVQNAVKLVRGLAIILPAVALILFALAVWLAGDGRRRHTLFFVGVDLLVAGIIVLVARNLGDHYVTNKLAQGETVRPAVNAAYTIGTDLLRDVASATLLFGLVTVVAAALAGPRRWAVAIRRALAPWLRHRPGMAYAALAVILLLIVLWGPIPATRKVIPVLIIFALAFLGLYALRAQTAEEFPDAREGDTSHALRAGASGAAESVRRRASHVTRGHSDPSAHADDRLERLERLSAMHDSGALTDEEFASEKASLMGTSTSAS
jgi:Short C-terminal domain